MRPPASSSWSPAVTPGRPGPEKAAWHYARALRYRQDARLLLERDGNPYSAGALLYESAKQCINALANQQGVNPGSTGAKLRFLTDIAEQESSSPTLRQDWDAATQLHIHADQGYLDEGKFAEAWATAQAFIEEMLLLYARSS